MHSTTPQLKEILKPSPVQTVTVILVSVLIHVFVNFSLLVARFGSVLLVDRERFGVVLDRYMDLIIQSPPTYYVVIILYWSGFGLVTYLGLWIMESLLVRAYNHYVVSRYYTEVTPDTAYKARRRLGHFIGTLFAALFLGALILTALYCLPFWLALSHQALTVSGMSIYYFVATSVFGLAFNIYVLLVLAKGLLATN